METMNQQHLMDTNPLRQGNAILQNFEPIKQDSDCPFETSSNFWGGCDGPCYSNHTAKINAAALTNFALRCSQAELLEGLVSQLPGDGDGDVKTLGNRVRCVLTDLTVCNPVGEAMLLKNSIDKRR